MSILLSNNLLRIIIYTEELNLSINIFKNNYVYYRPYNNIKKYLDRLYRSPTALYLYRNYLLIYPNFRRPLN